jgi:hypothetical protein
MVDGIPTRCPTCGSAVIATHDGKYEPAGLELLDLAEHARKEATAHRRIAETYVRALWRIADADSGGWGRIAWEALREAETVGSR